MLRNRPGVGIGVVVSAVMVTLIGSPAASGASGEPGGTPIEDFPEVAWYAERYGVGLEEANHRVALEEEAGMLEEALASNEPASFAGAWIEHEPRFRVVALFTSEGEETLRRYVVGSPLEAIAEAGSARYTLAELRGDQEQVMELHMSLKGREDFESTINIQMNRVEVFTATPEAYEAVTAALPDLPASVVVVQVSELSQPAANIYGGLPLSNGCTSGFTVQVTGGTTKGITTAGHCGNSASYSGTNLPYQAGQYSGNTDAQWHTTPGFINRNWVWDDQYDQSTPYYRVITSKIHRNNQTEGMTICKYGRSSGYDCGTLIDKNYDPSDNCVPSSTSTWMWMWDGGNDIADNGDSGGPVFRLNAAVGTFACIKGGTDVIYMAQNYLSNIGVGVWLGG